MARRERLFYVIAAWITLAVAALGFRNFYFLGGKGFGGNPLTHQIVPVILVHAAAMTSWTLLLVVQSHLVLRGQFRHHRLLGWIGAGLAAAMVVLGSLMGVLSAHYNPQAYLMFSGPKFFLMEMLTEIALFGTLITIAIVRRTRPAIHRPFVLTATVVVSSGALARVPLIDALAATPPLYAYGPVLLYGALLLGLNTAMLRRVDRWFALALAIVVVVFALSIPVGHGSVWQQFWTGYLAD